jgi:hypothetical protein
VCPDSVRAGNTRPREKFWTRTNCADRKTQPDPSGCREATSIRAGKFSWPKADRPNPSSSSTHHRCRVPNRARPDRRAVIGSRLVPAQKNEPVRDRCVCPESMGNHKSCGYESGQPGQPQGLRRPRLANRPPEARRPCVAVLWPPKISCTPRDPLSLLHCAFPYDVPETKLRAGRCGATGEEFRSAVRLVPCDSPVANREPA